MPVERRRNASRCGKGQRRHARGKESGGGIFRCATESRSLGAQISSVESSSVLYVVLNSASASQESDANQSEQREHERARFRDSARTKSFAGGGCPWLGRQELVEPNCFRFVPKWPFRLETYSVWPTTSNRGPRGNAWNPSPRNIQVSNARHCSIRDSFQMDQFASIGHVPLQARSRTSRLSGMVFLRGPACFRMLEDRGRSKGLGPA